jgi:YafQ family addiction module toxin component
MRNYTISDNLKSLMKKLSKKNNRLYEQLIRKIEEIINSENIDHYKNLKYGLKDSKRVHIGHFVLVFQYNNKENEILFDDFDHHDVIYTK